MKKNNFSVLCFFLVLALNSCASTPLTKPSSSSRENYADRQEFQTEEIKKAISDGRVINGMTKEDVRASWGDPSHIDYYNKEEYDEIWTYKGALFSLLEPSKYVTFKNNHVIEVYIAEN